MYAPRWCRSACRQGAHALAVPAVLLGLAGCVRPARATDMPWNYAVQLTASIDAANSQITLQWTPPDGNAQGGLAPQHIIYRKAVSDLANPDWGDGTTLPAGQNSFTDSVQRGVAYEYKVARVYPGVDPQFNGVGYIRTGIEVPLVDTRGTLLLVVESGVADALSDQLAQYTNDCMGDGWRVVRIDGFSSSSNPSDLRARIRQEYGQDQNVQAVILVGHLPVILSGTATNPDGHFIRPMPADGFYGDVSGDWGPGSFDGQHWVFPANTFPAPLALEVGRVDFADMPAIYAVSPYSSEVDLLRNYFAKDHAYRLALRVPQRQALIGDAMGEYYFEGAVEPFSAEGYRNFAPLVGGRLAVADNYHGGSNASNWLSVLTNDTYEWAFGCGAGGDSGDSIAALGPNDELTSTDLVAQNARADFYLLFGSFIVDWTKPNNLLRAALAPADYGLASAWAGRPFLYFHAMGLGETIGYGMRISENESGTLYDTPVKVRPSGNTYVNGVYMALLGDPTLRLDPVPPVTNLSVNQSGTVTWTPPSGVSVTEYRVYWLNPSTGGYELENTVAGDANSYTSGRTGQHMIRAVTLTSRSGTYYNASEGVAWDASGATSPAASGGSNSGDTGGGSTSSTSSLSGPVAPGDAEGPPSLRDPRIRKATFAIPVLLPGYP